MSLKLSHVRRSALCTLAVLSTLNWATAFAATQDDNKTLTAAPSVATAAPYGPAFAGTPYVRLPRSRSEEATLSTVTTLTAPATAVLGQAITVTVTVQTSAGAAVANSTVELYNGSTYTGLNATTNASGVATFVFGAGNALYTGTYTLEAQFPASGNYLASATASSSTLLITAPTYTTTGDGLQLATVQAGSGPGAVTGQNLTVYYTGFYQSTGAEFDESSAHAPPNLSFTLNADPEQVISGFDEGSTGIEIGETRVMVIPSDLGYMDGTVRIFVVESLASTDPGPTTSMVFTQPPTATISGGTISPAVTVSLLNAVDAPNSSDASSVTLSIASGPSGATLSGATTVAAAAGGGVATFDNLVLSTPGTYTLTASNGTLTAISPAFTVGDSTDNAVPAITSISPSFTSAGGSAFTVTVSGSGFVSGSTVYWGSTALTTTYVSASELTAQVPASDVVGAGITDVTVQTPAPGGGTSETFDFEVDSAASGGSQSPTVTTTTVVTVQAGSSASYSVTVPAGTTVKSVQALNLPAGATASYDSTTDAVVIATSSATPLGTYQITLVFNATVPATASAQLGSPSGFGGAPPALILAVLLPLGLPRRKSAPRKTFMKFRAVMVLVTMAILIAGCGGGSSGGSSSTSSGSGTSTTTPPTTTTQTTSSAVTLTVQ